MSDKPLIGALLTGILIGVLILAAAAKGRQLERAQPAHVTKQWAVSVLPRYDGLRWTQVDVIDTAGVCLYVARSEAFSQALSPAIAAVPKSQLPAGTGCQ
jgi:hypothetical protein